MSYSSILYAVEDGIATITFNNPAKLNPMSENLQRETRDALAKVAADTAVRALVLTGAGKAFCVGADLSTMGAPAEGESLGERTLVMMRELSNRLIADIRALPVPVVSAVNGPAAGAGVGIALAADVVVAARSAYFYLPFMAKLGIVPDLGTTWFVPRLVGRARATALTLLGDRLPAEKAEAWGLVWSCVDDAALAAEANQIARRLAESPSHAAVETRLAYDASERNSLVDQMDYEAGRQRELLNRESFHEGVSAFMAKRAPVFKGR